MKFITVGYLLFFTFAANAAELTDIEARVLAQKIRATAAENVPLDRDELIGICRGREGARWCEGYIASLLVSLDVPRTLDCLPRTDMAPFQYGNVWELTQNWLYEHPEMLEVTLFQAITRALKDQEQCEF